MRNFFAWVAAGLFLGVMLFSAQRATTAGFDQGKQLFEEKCAPCHGPNGEGNGPMAKKITDIIKNGKGQMIPVSVGDAEIKAIVDYMSHTFKK